MGKDESTSLATPGKKNEDRSRGRVDYTSPFGDYGDRGIPGIKPSRLPSLERNTRKKKEKKKKVQPLRWAGI